ncbi:MAG: sugar-binding domain-containing protein [Verrucomicrobiota bacterium]|jgi:beta-galactosidase
MKHTSFPLFWMSAALVACGLWHTQSAPAAANAYAPPASPRVTYNFNPDWKFIRQDAPGAQEVSFNDSAWTNVSLPHTWNDVDSYRALISHGGGDQTIYEGVGWYRKHFKMPAGSEGRKIILEFEGLKQAAHFFLNGQPVGLYENGITACGLDITALVKFGGQDNVLAVKVDNTIEYKEESSGMPFEWKFSNSNPSFGGLNRDVWLHVMGKVYQTLPLYENLHTTGVYVYGKDYDVKNKSVSVNVEAQARNETADSAGLALSAVVVDADGVQRAQFAGPAQNLAAGQTATLTATGPLAGARFWDVDDPYLYDVYSILSVNGKVADVCKIHTGFRKAEYKGGAGTGGVWLNDHFVWLTGYAQRAVNDWPGLGQAYPDWMHDFNAALLRESHGNYVRWMHISPQRVDVTSCDKYGIADVCPAGDGEHDVFDRQWQQRMEVMRDSIIYFRNHPSILFWEAGNSAVVATQMVAMVDLRKQWDPNGGRAMGCRSLSRPDAIAASEYVGTMLGRPTEGRDHGPLIETEDFRDEGPRGIWDDFSPPSFGFKKGRNDSYAWNSETFALAGIRNYFNFVSSRIDNPNPARSEYSAYGSIYWSDSDADGRQQSSEVLRVSGKVDGVRLPKEIFYASRVMQSDTPDLHIIGHWTYPPNTRKTVNVIASHCDSVELFVNGESLGVKTTPQNGYIYAFPDVAFAPGVIRAVATKGGKVVAQQEIPTAGDPVAIKLTLHTGPKGLQADGSDVALVDFEAVDAQGRRCPTDQARVDFDISGPAIWRGGLNSAKTNSTNNRFLDTECGINRVSIRSTRAPGTITLTAKREGLQTGTLTFDSKPVVIQDGLSLEMPQTMSPVARLSP